MPRPFRQPEATPSRLRGPLLALALTLIAPSAGLAATLEVNTASDELDTPSGATLSLREAARDALDGDTLTFAAALDGQTITVLSFGISLQADLTVDASALPNGLTLSGGGSNRILAVNDNNSVTIRSLTFADGSDQHGSAILMANDASLVVEDCDFRDNSSNGSGGAIYNRDDGSLDVVRCKFTGNYATGSGGALCGFSRTNQTTIIDCEFRDNQALTQGGAVCLGSLQAEIVNSLFIGNRAGREGGGAWLTGPTNVQNTTLARNEAEEGGGLAADSDVIMVNCTVADNYAETGGGIFTQSGDLFLDHVTLAGNSSVLAGGGIQSAGPTTLRNSIVAGNRCLAGPGTDLKVDDPNFFREGANLIGDHDSVEARFPPGSPNADGDYVGTPATPLPAHLAPLHDFGGDSPTRPPLPGSLAIDTATGGQVIDQRGLPRPEGAGPDLGATELSYLTDRFSPENGESGVAVRTMLWWIFEPTADSYEVRLGLDPQDLASQGSVEAGLFTPAELLPATTYHWQVLADVAGQIIASPVQSFTTRPDLVVTTEQDSLDPLDGQTSLREAIEIAATQPGFDRIVFDPSLAGGTLTLGGAHLAIRWQEIELDGSALSPGLTISGNGLSHLFQTEAPAILTLRNLGLTRGTSLFRGSAIYALSSSAVRAFDCSFFANESTTATTVWAEYASLSLERCTLTDNEATAVHSRGAAPCELVDCVVSNNNGDGLLLSNGAAGTVRNCQLIENAFSGLRTSQASCSILDSRIAGNAQQGIKSVESSPLVIEACVIEENVERGIWASNESSLTIANCTIRNNSATSSSSESGAGARIDGGFCTIVDSTFQGNNLSKGIVGRGQGGALFISGGTVAIARCLFHSNAGRLGGAIYAEGNGSSSLTNSTFLDNRAEEDGGALWVRDGVTLSHLTITANQAGEAGGGIYVAGSNNVMGGCVIAGNRAPAAPDISKGTSTPPSPITRAAPNLIGTNANSELEFPASPSPGAANLDGDFVGTTAHRLDPLLSPLGNFGGPTLSLLPLPGSPLVDQVAAADAPPQDQRGTTRPAGASADLGATELTDSHPAFFPADGESDFSLASPLRWTFYPGAESYAVLLGTAPDTLELVGTTTAGQFNMRLDGDTTYYWQVIAEDGAPIPGPVISFTTRPALMVDTVDDLVADDGLTSLREAVALAAQQEDFDLIVFAPALSGATLTLDAPLQIEAQSLGLDGSSLADRPTISGQDAQQLFQVSNLANLTLRNLRLANGSAENGGALTVSSQSTVVTEGCEFADNTATGFGGAIYCETHANLTIRDTVFSRNHALSGGALWLQSRTGPLVIEDSLFDGNSSDQDAGALGTDTETFGSDVTVQINIARTTWSNNSAGITASGSGGAILIAESFQPVIISACSFTQNSATSRGGAIVTNDGWTLDEQRTSVLITGSSFQANHAIIGGALHLEDATAELSNCTLAENSASRGGALHATRSTVDLNHLTVTGNHALPGSSGGGGGIYALNGAILTIRNSLIAANNGTPGPDLHLSTPGLTIQRDGVNLIGIHDEAEDFFPAPDAPELPNANGDLVGTTDSPLDPLLLPIGDYGGPTETVAFLSGSPAHDRIATSALTEDQRTVPRPQGPASDIGAFEGSNSDARFFPANEPDVAIDTSLAWLFELTATRYEVYFGTVPGPLTLLGTTSIGRFPLSALAENTAYSWRVDAIEGGTTTPSPVFTFTTRGPIVVTTDQDTEDPSDGLLSLREAITIATTQRGFDRIVFDPGLSGGTMILSSTLVIVDQALEIDGAALPQPLTLSGDGVIGIFSLVGGAVSLNGLHLTGGNTSRGGAINAFELDHLNLTDCTISSSTARDGGGLFARFVSDLTIDGCEFRSNTCLLSGGVLRLTGSTVTITNSAFRLNEGDTGGAINSDTSVLEVADCVFEDNTAETGAAITAQAHFTCHRCRFSRNVAQSGGALFLNRIQEGQVTRCLFEDNRALDDTSAAGGGAVAMQTITRPPAPYFLDCTFAANHAKANGGAVLVPRDASLAFTNCTFAGNSAARSGGAVASLSRARNQLITHCTIVDNRAGTGGGVLGLFVILNSIVAGNEATGTNDDLSDGITLAGSNLLGSNDGVESIPPSPTPDTRNRDGHFVGTVADPLDPMLAPLDFYGTALPVRPPLPGSPVIDSADPALAPPRDQLAHLRPLGPAPDLGAVEAFPFSTLSLLDTDLDGIDDRLEPAYGFTVGVDESAVDTDRDGSPDGEEIRNMTDPRDPSDFLRILSIRLSDHMGEDTPSVIIRWSSFPGLGYDVLQDATLPFTDPLVLSGGPAIDSTQELTVPLDGAQSFFQVRRN